ncbi:MAG TPA: acyl carrier protein [Burkholderiaceae bacterium]|nr:acyl carrier protein [Burkholderiaceae bacterium]
MSKTIDELKSLIQKNFDIAPEAIDENAAFSDYELDSLTLAELMFAIDDELHVIVPDSAFAEIRTLAQLATVVDGLRSQGLPAHA